jgi:hypothetical protein
MVGPPALGWLLSVMSHSRARKIQRAFRMSQDTERHLRPALALPVGFVPIRGPDNGSMTRGVAGSLKGAFRRRPTHHVVTHSIHISCSYRYFAYGRDLWRSSMRPKCGWG